MPGSRELANDRGMVHERTLLGAIDTHLGDLAHNRPWVLNERSEALEEMAERPSRSQTLAEFVGWAADRGLVPGEVVGSAE